MTTVSTFINLISFVLVVRSLQDGQNHLLAPVNSSGPNFFLMDLGTEEVKGSQPPMILCFGLAICKKNMSWMCDPEFLMSI